MTGRILIADAVATNRIILKSRLTEAAYGVDLARTITEMLKLALTTAPNVILLSDTLGLEALKILRSESRLSLVPVLYLSEDTRRSVRLDAIKAGADAVLECLPDTLLLRARLRNLMKRSAETAELVQETPQDDAFGLAEPATEYVMPGQVALVAPNLSEGLAWRNELTPRLRDRIAVLDPAQALRDLTDMRAPDAVIVGEPKAAPADALRMISDLRSRTETLHSAVLLSQVEPDLGRKISALDLGVCDVVDDGFDAEEMALHLRRELARKSCEDQRRAELQKGVRLANTDPLTGLLNRRAGLRSLERVRHNSAQHCSKYAVMVLDLDRFKSVNDRFGHLAGDAVLIATAKRMKDSLRQGDFMARIGGEEFLAVLRRCDHNSAHVAAERLRCSVADTPIKLPNEAGHLSVTVSIGLVVGDTQLHAMSAAELLDLADRALYSAKADGRNQVNEYQSAA